MEKISSLMNITFDSDLFYGETEKYMKTKIKIIDNKVCTNFYSKEMPKKTYCIQVFVIDNVRFCY